MSSTALVPILLPDGRTTKMARPDQLKDAMANGAQLAYRVRFGDKVKYVAHDQLPEAYKSGGVAEPAHVADAKGVTAGDVASGVGEGALNLIKGVAAGPLGIAAGGIKHSYDNLQSYRKTGKTTDQIADDTRKNEGHDLAYRFGAPLAEAFGADVQGMEAGAREGDPGKVANRFAAAETPFIAAPLAEPIARGAGAGLNSRVGRGIRGATGNVIKFTAGKALAPAVEGFKTGYNSGDIKPTSPDFVPDEEIQERVTGGGMQLPKAEDIPHPEYESPWGGNTSATGTIPRTRPGLSDTPNVISNEEANARFHGNSPEAYEPPAPKPIRASKSPDEAVERVTGGGATLPRAEDLGAFPEEVNEPSAGYVNPEPSYRGLGPEPQESAPAPGPPIKIARQASPMPFVPSDYMQGEGAAVPGHSGYTAPEPRWAYRSRDVGETGVPNESHSQATLNPEQAEGYLTSRGEYTGKPQEMIRTDLNRLQPHEYEIQSTSAQPDFVKFRRPLTEEEIEKYGNK